MICSPGCLTVTVWVAWCALGRGAIPSAVIRTAFVSVELFGSIASACVAIFSGGIPWFGMTVPSCQTSVVLPFAFTVALLGTRLPGIAAVAASS